MSEKVGVKLDGGKLRWDLIPLRAQEEMVKVLTFGAHKYGPDNWRRVKGWRWRYSRALVGHVFKYMGGEAFDQETGLHHLAHALCCAAFLLEFEILGTPDGDEGREDKIPAVSFVKTEQPRKAIGTLQCMTCGAAPGTPCDAGLHG